MITVTIDKINGEDVTNDIREINSLMILPLSMRPLTANTTSSACVFDIETFNSNGNKVRQTVQVTETYAAVKAALTADSQGATQSPSVGIATGVDLTYAVTLSPAVSSLTEGVPFYVKFGTTNTGASSLSVNGSATKPLKKGSGGATALAANDLVTTKWYPCIYDDTNIQVLDL